MNVEDARVKAAKELARELLKPYPADYLDLSVEDYNGLLKLIHYDLMDRFPKLGYADQEFIMDWVRDAISEIMIEALFKRDAK